MEYLLLILGLAGLWLGAELVIKGALHIAEHYKISHLFIGLTLLTVGTDLPELFVENYAAFMRLGGVDNSELIIGQVIGTTFSQIGLILGVAGLLGTLAITKRQIMRDGLMMIASVVLFYLAAIDGQITSIEGGIFILIYLFYFVTLYQEERLHEKIKRAPKLDKVWAVLSLISGVALLGISSKITLDSALDISEVLGVPQHLVGILVVGLGTSLPELATVLPALRNDAGKMLVGNLIGSNTFDLLVTVGTSAIIAEYTFNNKIVLYDVPVLLLLSLLVIIFFSARKKLIKKEALVLLLIYVIYFSVKIVDAVLSV